MDELLPSEILSKVASYLSYKDVNSLFLISKTCHSKLTPYKKLLPKIPINVEIYSIHNLIILQVEFMFGKKDRYMKTLVERGETEKDEFTEEEKKAQVISFYKSRQSQPQANDIRIERKEGLDLHIQTILTFGTIEEMIIEQDDSDDDNFVWEELARITRSTRCRVDRLRIISNRFHQSQIDILKACQPRCLSVQVPQLPDEFYKLSLVQRLTELKDYSQEKKVYNVSSLSANDIEIFGNHQIPIDDFRQFMNQWAEAKREVLHLSVKRNATLSEEIIMDWMENLDRQLVRVELYLGREGNWLLTRCSDLASLVLCFARGIPELGACLYIYVIQFYT